MRETELDTKDRILGAAEQLFGERGVAGTSLRAITAHAGVNLAAVHYHFGSKQGLMRAVVERRVGPVNEARLKRLDQIEAAGPLGPDSVEAIVRALLRPALELWEELGREPVSPFVFTEPVETVGPLLAELFGEVTRRFTAALERALPDLPGAEVAERFQFMIGAMIHVLSGRIRILPLPGGERSGEQMLEALVAHAAAGLRAPARGGRA